MLPRPTHPLACAACALTLALLLQAACARPLQSADTAAAGERSGNVALVMFNPGEASEPAVQAARGRDPHTTAAPPLHDTPAGT